MEEIYWKYWLIPITRRLTDFNEDTTNESASVACSNVRLWKLDTQNEWRNTSWRLWGEWAEKDSVGFVDRKKTNEWVLNKVGVKRELLDTVKARKLAYYSHNMRKQGSCLEKEKMQWTMPDACRRLRPRMAWMDNINMWAGLPVEESIRMTEDRDKWRKYVHGVANFRIEDG